MTEQLAGAERARLAQKAADLYATGISVRAVAEEIGRSFGCTRYLILEAGGKLRSRGHRRRS
ncbi:helix-turn-helix domain-containing protein [Streptomyces sp. NPDC058045]|uniref:helix-turn-helix domain-containing protein n=1 Tax=Streptomyces sp. NPDC058045 TaxID=3346311 RepID=UPI0036E99C54